jgi:hypothetical protein
VINTEAFSPKGLKQKKTVSLEDLPWVVRKFLSVFPQPFIVLDECFVAGTPVDVLNKDKRICQKPIDFVSAGDIVLNAIGEDYVETTVCKEVTSLVEICSAGSIVACSKNHRFFTLQGWKSAKNLRAGDYLVETAQAVRLLRTDIYTKAGRSKMAAFLRKKLLREMADAADGDTEQSVHSGTEPDDFKKDRGLSSWRLAGSAGADRAYTGAESDAGRGCCPKDAGDQGAYRDTGESSPARRERTTASRSRQICITHAKRELAAGMCCLIRQAKAGISDLLQTRYREPGYSGRTGDRRTKPCRETQNVGQKEGQGAGFVRVESVSVLEQGSIGLDKYRDAEGRIYCYDIKAKRHHSFSVNGVLVHNCSKIKCSTPMKETDKSSRARTIKLLNKFGHRCIMTGTLMSKSPLNVVDPYNFLKEGYFPESMWALAEAYCVMETIRVGRGRRVLISQKDYAAIRTRLKNAFIRGGEAQLEAAKESIFKQYAIDYAKQEHIIRHKKYTPFINEKELLRRIAPDTLFVRRDDVFDIQFDKFVKEPIMRPVSLSKDAKRIANELIELGFTDRLVLGKAPALELVTRLQDICNGFEPVKDAEGNVSYRPLLGNPKLDELIDLLEEIDVRNNQIVVWASRRNLLDLCAARFEKEGYAFVRYDGSANDTEKENAEQAFIKREARIFLANQASGAFGLNCLAQCSYAVYMCVDGSVERYHQSQYRILRGQLTAPKFSYAIYAEGTVEERQWDALRVGKELIEADNRKEKFIFV